MTNTWPSHTITWPSHDPHMTLTWPTHDHHMTITWPSHDPHMTITWPSHDHHMTNTWPSHDHHMTLTWPSHDHHMTAHWDKTTNLFKNSRLTESVLSKIDQIVISCSIAIVSLSSTWEFNERPWQLPQILANKHSKLSASCQIVAVSRAQDDHVRITMLKQTDSVQYSM